MAYWVSELRSTVLWAAAFAALWYFGVVADWIGVTVFFSTYVGWVILFWCLSKIFARLDEED